MQAGARCGCNHSLAVICGVFAAIAVALVLAERGCVDAGGSPSDTAWLCETASGVATSLWVFVTPGIAAIALLVGVPVYFALAAAGRRWLFGGTP